MDYDRFTGLVQSRGRMATRADAVAATRATLETLAERIDPHEAHHLASQLPREIGAYLESSRSSTGERFSFDAFCKRVAEREHEEVSTALFHARCVLETVQEAVSPGEIRDVRSQLSTDFQPLFDAGSQGRMKT
jgi:uncharacterized protein (DUF2267 family)